jgi:hypothetical protein
MVGHVSGPVVHRVILVRQVVVCWLVDRVNREADHEADREVDHVVDHVMGHVQNLVILFWLRCVMLIGVYVGLVFYLVYVFCM